MFDRYNHLVLCCWKHDLVRAYAEQRTHIWHLWFLRPSGVRYVDVERQIAFQSGLDHGIAIGRHQMNRVKKEMDG